MQADFVDCHGTLVTPHVPELKCTHHKCRDRAEDTTGIYSLTRMLAGSSGNQENTAQLAAVPLVSAVQGSDDYSNGLLRGLA